MVAELELQGEINGLGVVIVNDGAVAYTMEEVVVEVHPVTGLLMV